MGNSNRNTQLELTYTPQEIGKELVITNPTEMNKE